MKKITFIVASLLVTLIGCKTTEVEQEVKLNEIVQVHQGAFAFCGASAAVPTGKKIIVQGVEFDEGCAVCPVLTGPSISIT
jgi:tagatose-1,6-bisphosphate aldolase non-catalytic subunit AgaZ/GatZ